MEIKENANLQKFYEIGRNGLSAPNGGLKFTNQVREILKYIKTT